VELMRRGLYMNGLMLDRSRRSRNPETEFTALSLPNHICLESEWRHEESRFGFAFNIASAITPSWFGGTVQRNSSSRQKIWPVKSLPYQGGYDIEHVVMFQAKADVDPMSH
jgi:hypothetical protein